MSYDSSAIDNALVAKLASDPALLALCPNGAYMDHAPQGSTKFVIVRLVISFDEGQMGDPGKTRAFEDIHYEVEARMLSTAGGNIAAAAARIDELLEDQPLTVAGLGWMDCHREERIRFIEVDEVSPDILWLRRGGRYRLSMSVIYS